MLLPVVPPLAVKVTTLPEHILPLLAVRLVGAVGWGLTVTATDIKFVQFVAVVVKVMVAVPVATPVTTPVVLFTVAIAVLPLAQDPPVVGDKVQVLPAHTGPQVLRFEGGVQSFGLHSHSGIHSVPLQYSRQSISTL